MEASPVTPQAEAQADVARFLNSTLEYSAFSIGAGIGRQAQ